MRRSPFFIIAAFLLGAVPAHAENANEERAALAYFQELDAASGRSRILAARYMEHDCKDVPKDWASSHVGLEKYAGLPVKRCFYPRSQIASKHRNAATLIAVVWMLNPDAPTIAKWIGTACTEADVASEADCGRRIARYVLTQNGAQFPVAGHVLETQSEAGCAVSVPGCEGDVLIYLPFRDGVTVKLQNDSPDQRRKETFADEKEALGAAEETLSDPASFQSVGDIGRIGNIYRLPKEKRLDWLERNRGTYLKALNGTSYEFFDEVVRAALSKKN
ncbi:hypothetical protein ACFYE9_32430 [Rhizobium leguminosarum]|uniref:Uncharacterized protein n=2 Tax=Rhizobium leguminosarum TaxID=384 RepID=A0A154IHH5_RHILE|nr:hypothetical protein [Rhizobium leguminosarum]KZA99881.1 hypothetical protein A4A59_20885 [Rhizobium leguminosarum]